MTGPPAQPARPNASGVFSPAVVLGVVLASIVSALAFLVLTAFAPELRTRSDGAAHALSDSAVGFAGLIELLRAEGVPVAVSRQADPDRGATLGLLVTTPEVGGDARAFHALHTRGAELIVLPKWSALPDPAHPGWVLRSGLQPAGVAAEVAARVVGAPGGVLTQRERPSRPVLIGGGDLFNPATRIPLATVQSFQAFSKLPAGWSPALIDERGGVVLAGRSDPRMFILTDPDFLNTSGLAQRDNAMAAGLMLNAMRGYVGPIAFDVTLNGFGRTRDVLQLMFLPPFLSATLCALACALLMGLHAAVRFGAAKPPARAFALGKRALADNSAALIRMAGREPAMAGRYAAMTRDLVGSEVAAAREGDDAALVSALERIGRTRRVTAGFSELDTQARAARDGSTLMRAARNLYRWRLEMTRGSS